MKSFCSFTFILEPAPATVISDDDDDDKVNKDIFKSISEPKAAAKKPAAKKKTAAKKG